MLLLSCTTFLLFVLLSLSSVAAVTATAERQPTTTGTLSEQYNHPSGPIDDAQCSMEDLEAANDSQLYEILQHLKTTAFFRNFVVDLEHKCPLDETEEQFECSGGGGGGGGALDDHDNDDDDDAEPALCTVQASSSEEQDPFSSTALHSIQESGFQSQAQHDAFTWKTVTDAVYTEKPEPAPPQQQEEESAAVLQQLLLPDSFWKDMCSSIGTGDGTTVINLALNPERNTFYNGTHIWNAIYQENCVLLDGNKDETMCFEERVLYRLLSGLHTSTTISIANNYYAPSKRKNRTDWEPNPEFFMEKFEHHPEYIRNLHFSFAVLLRALRKATPFLYNLNAVDIVDGTVDETAEILLKRLLDSAILQSCSSVFDAFDESRMFQIIDSDDDHVVQCRGTATKL